MFKIAFAKLVQWLVPTWLRSNTMVLLVLAANKPLREAYDKFLTYRDAVDYKIEHNCQVFSIEAVLNDSFDLVLRRIRVVNFVVFGATYFFDEDEEVLFIGDEDPCYLYASDTGLDFTIQVPKTIINSPAKVAALKAKTNEYKMAGKQFFIQEM